MKLTLHAFELPLRHTFTISRESIEVQDTLIVELIDGDVHGYGESTTNQYYGYTIENMAAALHEIRPQLESQTLVDPETLWEQLRGTLDGIRSPSARWISLRMTCGESCAASRYTDCGA
jgi:L-Ala-D/L-Glu epimerase